MMATRFILRPVSGGDDWMLNRFSHVLAIALRKKLWTTKQLQPLVPFAQVIDRVKQAQPETEKAKARLSGDDTVNPN